ncbi:hypothetical protein TSAR_008921, partial [Trichomalopsis sarcophagae]
ANIEEYRRIILKNCTRSEASGAPGDRGYREYTTLLKKPDGSPSFQRSELQLRRFDDSLSLDERAIIDKVWIAREKLIRFQLAYSPESITRREDQSLMEEQNKMFLAGIDMLIKGLTLPASATVAMLQQHQQQKILAPATEPSQATLTESVNETAAPDQQQQSKRNQLTLAETF